MPSEIVVRPIAPSDLAAWRPLWDGYNAFYGRAGETALPEAVTASTWARFFDEREPVHAFVAELDGRLVGLTHYLFHRSTTRIEDTCYLQDLFTAADVRGRGVGRALIAAVTAAVQARGGHRLYWQTHTTNAAGRALYDRVAEHKGFLIYGQDF
jgi:GNAT superfamily N-acetyltransferase